MGFAKPYVENALTNRERGLYTKLGSIVLHWPDLAGPLLLDVRDAKILGVDGHTVVEVDEAAITLSKAGFFIGRIMPVGLILKHPQLTLIRGKEGKIDVGFGPRVKEEDVKDQTALTERILEYVARPGKESGSPLAALKLFEIQDAQVNVEDRQSGTTSFLPEVNVAFRSTGQGLDADMMVSFDDTPEWPSRFRASLLIPWETRDVVMEANLENFDLEFLADKIPALAILDGQDIEVDGRLYAVLDSNFRPQQAQLIASSTGGSFMIPEFSDGRVPYEDFFFEVNYNVATERLDVPGAKVTVKGVTIAAEAALRATEKEIAGPIKFSIKDLKQSQIKPLWPKFLEGDNAEEWIVEKMSEGVFPDVSAVIEIFALRSADGKWDVGAEDAQGFFTFENMAVDYRAPMIPVKKAKGSGEFKLAEEKLSIDIEDGVIGDMKVHEAELEFVNIIEAGKGKADIRVKLEGPLKNGFEYLSREPITLEHDFDLEKVKGNASATINVAFPTKDIRVKDVKVNAEGVMSDVTLPGVMKRLELTGGPLNFTIKDNLFVLKGDAKIQGRDAKIDYREFLNSEGQEYKSKVVASLPVDNAMRTLIGMDLSDFLDGDAYVDVVYTEFAGGKAEADLNVDLKPSLLFFKPLGYEKKPGEAANTTMRATLQDGNLKTVTGLKATGPQLQIDNANFRFTEKKDQTALTGGDIGSFVAGETIAKMKFDITDAGKYVITVNGSFFDLRPSLDGESNDETYNEPPMEIALTADRLRASENEPLQHARLNVDIDGRGSFNNLELTGVAGKGNVSIRYQPDASGKRAFRMEADDAGATLRAFGVYDNIVGGKLDIYGAPIKGINDRNVKGLGTITNFKVVKAPTLARLLGMLSLPGVLSGLSGDGLSFTKLEADFDWVYRPKGSLLVVKDGRTSGNSVGFTFDGTYDKNKSFIDVDGTMIPLSGVNKVIGNIPLIGDILTGGSGGVFAATYSVKGDAKAPQVFVNPLSVLTPGILRRILFEQN
ncbi:MAG: DUF3971 domain-containing protein [Alphaproteobacteria bacterium]